MVDAYPADFSKDVAQAAEDEVDIDIAAAFKAFTDPAVYNQPIKEDVKTDPTLSTTKVGRMQKLSKLELNEQQSRTLCSDQWQSLQPAKPRADVLGPNQEPHWADDNHCAP